MVDDKPLFIPLRTEWYRAFESGVKSVEYRAYGARWNERTCRPGRRAVLSQGYGKRHRLTRTVLWFSIMNAAQAPSEARAIYPNTPFIAAIGLGK